MTLKEAPGAEIRGETIYFVVGFVAPGHCDGRLRGRFGNSVDAQVFPAVRRSTSGVPVEAPDRIRCHEAKYEANRLDERPDKLTKGAHTFVHGYLRGEAWCQIMKPHPGARR